MKNKLLFLLGTLIVALCTLSGCSSKIESKMEAIVEERDELQETVYQIGNDMYDVYSYCEDIIERLPDTEDENYDEITSDLFRIEEIIDKYMK